MTREYTDEQITDMQNINLSSSDIAKKYKDLPKSTIRAWRRRNHIFIPRCIDFNAIDINELQEKFNECKNLELVAQYYGCDRHTLSKWLKKNNIDIGLKEKIPQDIIDKVLLEYNYASAVSVAKKYHLTQSAVSGIWYRYGLRGKVPRIYNMYNEDFFSTQSRDMAYFCGLISSDGCIYTSKDTRSDMVSITLQKNDEYILQKLLDKLKSDKPILHVKYKKTGRCYSNLEISSQKICDNFKKLGINNRKTYGNSIAKIDDKYMFDFIRGYIDGDGTISENGNISIVGYMSNMEKIQNFLNKFNILSNIIVDKRTYRKNDFDDNFVTLCFSNKTSSYCLAKMLYYNVDSLYLIRKKNNADKIIQQIEESNNVRDKQIVIYYKNAVLRLRDAMS